MSQSRRTTKKKIKKSFPSAIVHVTSTQNNTKLTATTPEGDVIAWKTAGSAGYKNTKRSTPYPASEAASLLMNQLKDYGVQRIDIISKGIFSGREAAIKTIGNFPGYKIGTVYDRTGFPHGGPRAKGRRRV